MPDEAPEWWADYGLSKRAQKLMAEIKRWDGVNSLDDFMTSSRTSRECLLRNVGFGAVAVDEVLAKIGGSPVRHWTDAFPLSTRARCVLLNTSASSPGHVLDLGEEFWRERPNCGAVTIAEFERVFGPFPRRSSKAACREPEVRRYQPRHRPGS